MEPDYLVLGPADQLLPRIDRRYDWCCFSSQGTHRVTLVGDWQDGIVYLFGPPDWFGHRPGHRLTVTWFFHRSTPRRVDKVFRWGQLVSAAWFSLGHGGND